MSEAINSGGAGGGAAEKRGLGRLFRKLPYLIVLIMAIMGVAYTSATGRPLFGYWEFLAIAMGIACVVTGWRRTTDREERRQVIVTQAMHWGAFLIAMNIVLWPSVNSFLNGPATGLALLLLLALGTFVAGVHLSLDIAILGIVLALTVPAIAWLKQSALLIALIGLVVVALVVAFWPRTDQRI